MAWGLKMSFVFASSEFKVVVLLEKPKGGKGAGAGPLALRPRGRPAESQPDR